MKKIILATLAAVLLFSPLAQAALVDFYDEIYTVESAGSTVAKNSFDISDPAPWLYIRLSSKFVLGTDSTTTVSKWNSPSGIQYTVPDPAPVTPDNEFWYSLPSWGTQKELGQWSLIASSTYNNVSKGFAVGEAGFTVTPEPFTASLFVLGGAALGARRFRRKKA